MTRDEITEITQSYIGDSAPPPRLRFNEKTAYFRCIKEVQMLVASCPSIINYVAYLNNARASQLTPEINDKATKLIQTITKSERNLAEKQEIDDTILAFKTLLETQRAYASSASLIYREEHDWLLPFKEKLKFYQQRGSENNEAIDLLLTTLPESISGSSVVLPGTGLLTCTGLTATLSYNSIVVDTAPLVTSGTKVNGSLVKNSKATADLSTNVTGTTKNITLLPTQFIPPIVTNYTSTQSIVQDIATAAITINTELEEVRTCLLVFGIPNTNTTSPSFTTVAFDPTTVSFYRKLSRVCYKWKHPEIVESIHKYGFNFVFNSTNVGSISTKLKKATQSVASYTDTRGILR